MKNREGNEVIFKEEVYNLPFDDEPPSNNVKNAYDSCLIQLKSRSTDEKIESKIYFCICLFLA